MRDPETLLRIVAEHAQRRPVTIDPDPEIEEIAADCRKALAIHDRFPPRLRASIAGLRIDGVDPDYALTLARALMAGYPETELIREVHRAEDEYLKGGMP
jgi:hypothetical protein